ncbi:unnamed protein product [Blepharisma stoltei]|uniref:Uncharacterized protein n=1 Tax=Blepharisma stoltei TaxID=1481888 RepID=A0AAU9J1V7_9CILI|nr:unnamed protein product [Blepharisma stoltei]
MGFIGTKASGGFIFSRGCTCSVFFSQISHMFILQNLHSYFTPCTINPQTEHKLFLILIPGLGKLFPIISRKKFWKSAMLLYSHWVEKSLVNMASVPLSIVIEVSVESSLYTIDSVWIVTE